MMTFCTLFDSYYLDKGLTLYRSLENCTEEFQLYIFCFDDKSFEVLNALKLKHAVITHHSEIEDEELLRLKKERSKAEYCWTCTPVIIEYVLKHYKEPDCTYIDADLYFFQNPQILFDEIKDAGANIVITEHRFKDNWNGRRLCKRSGRYCVEFNYFDQSENAWEALTWWKKKCFEWCYHLYEPERMGDQKYLEKFPQLFQGVHELKHLGGGVAPWNLGQYKLRRTGNDRPTLIEKKTGEEFPLIFYHFQNIRYLSENMVNVSSGTHSKETKDAIYRPYLAKIEESRQQLKDYGITFSVKKIYSSNKLIAFLQGNVLRFKVKSISDVYQLKQFRSMEIK
ncbi:MAG: glycosyl transferase [Lachnospiraceae bacterium]|nr:glycosyl transferase [Lachnospiraceae bacterium]